MDKGKDREKICAIRKPTKENARNCALGLLVKAMQRTLKKTSTNDSRANSQRFKLSDSENSQIGFTPAEIEEVIFDYYHGRDQYLSKIAKVALHLSLFTRTGRVSFTFQEAIFNKNSNKNSNKKTITQRGQDDYLTWLMTNARDEDVFPELYLSQDYVEKIDRDNFERQMHLEHDALLAGLQEVVRTCCDSKICTIDEVDTSYDKELFRSGTVFETAARSICMTRRIDSWIPPSTEIYVPDTTPMVNRSSLLPAMTLSDASTTLQENNMAQAKQAQGKMYGLEKESYERNFDVSGQVMCFDVNNLIANLAELEPGRRMVLPWAGELLSRDLTVDFIDKFRVEIAMRKYFLASLALE